MSAYSDLILASSPNFYYTMEDAFRVPSGSVHERG